MINKQSWEVWGKIKGEYENSTKFLLPSAVPRASSFAYYYVFNLVYHYLSTPGLIYELHSAFTHLNPWVQI